MILLVSSNVRSASLEEPSGYIFQVDLTKQQVIRKAVMHEPHYQKEYVLFPPPENLKYDPNHRGGFRGVKSILFVEDKVCIGNTVAIYVFNSNWELVHKISHPSCSGIHDFIYHQEHFWISSTRNDLVLKMNWKSEVKDYLNFRESPEILASLNCQRKNLLEKKDIISGAIDFRDPRSHNIALYNGGHVNSVCALDNGDILVSAGHIFTGKETFFSLWIKNLQRSKLWEFSAGALKKKLREWLNVEHTFMASAIGKKGNSAIIRFSQKQPSLFYISHHTVVPNHSLRVLPNNNILFCDTNNGNVVILSEDGSVIKKIHVCNNFLRGAVILDDHHVVVGSGTNIFLVDLAKEKILSQIKMIDDERISIYDIAIMPETFSLFPLNS